MNKFIKPILCLFLATAVVACKKDKIALPDNLINFEATAQGFEAGSTEVVVKVNLSRAAETAVPVSIQLTSNKAVYGSEFITDAAAVNNVISLTIPAGQTSTSFKVLKPATTVVLNGDESVDFKINSVGSSVVLGASTTLKLSFKAIISDGSQLTLEGKTPASNYTNTVFVDLSGNKQIPVDRKSWNIALTSDSKFRVVLNPAYQSTAVATSKTDINAVTLADPGTAANLNHDISDPATATLVDNWNGDITKTVFAEVSATDSENKVYLLSFEGNKDKDKWFKVKVSRTANGGYKIQYARLGETAIKTLEVSKNADFNLAFVSLETDKVVNVEPRKASWDIAWSYTTYDSGLGSPYWFQDFILLNNLGGVQSAEVMTTTVSYAAFTEANIAGLTFSATRDAIGSKWRSTQPATGARTDRFYVIKDGSGNVYKLKFVSMGVGSDGGERGKPVIEYKLVKKG